MAHNASGKDHDRSIIGFYIFTGCDQIGKVRDVISEAKC